MYAGDIVGLSAEGLTSDESWQCRRCAGVSYSTIIACTQSGKLLLSCLNSILYTHNCQFLNFRSE